MIRGTAILAALLSLLAGASCSHGGSGSWRWSVLPSVDASTDYGKGVSAAAAGDISGRLVVAGGANFPDTPAAEGGRKHFYDDIMVLDSGAWLRAGTLPAPTAYAAVYPLSERIIIAGGANEAGSLAEVYSLTVDEAHDGQSGIFASVHSMPSLPVPIEQAAAARNGDMLYLAGGLSDGVPSVTLYALNLACDGGWEAVAEMPEPFVQPVAAAYGGTVYIWGGFDPARRITADYGYAYDTAKGVWRRIEGHPDGGTMTGATAVQDADGRMFVTGGVDKRIFDSALNMPAEQSADYLSQPAEYYRFRRTTAVFDPETESWSIAGESEHTARAGAAAVLSSGRLTVINGETKPGIRSSEIVQTNLNEINRK